MSRAKPNAALSEHELAGLFAEAFEAFDMDDERVRFDSAGRRWVFVPVMRDDKPELMLKLSRTDHSAERYLSKPIMTANGREAVKAMVRELAGIVA